MKNLLLFLTAALCAFALTAGERFEPRAVSPRRISLDPKQSIKLVPGSFEVVVSPGATPTARYAGKELAETLGKVFGTKITPVSKSSGKTALIVGDKKLAADWGVDLKSLDRDGYYIKSKGDQILLIGNDDRTANPANNAGFVERATLFAVQEFLERFAGVRYYFPGEIGTVIPKKKELILPAIDLADRPDMQFRSWYISRWKNIMEDQKWDYAGAPKNFASQQKFRMRSCTLDIPNCHGLSYLDLVERFGKTHPEYFALNANGARWNGQNKTGSPLNDRGQLCWSNRELREILLQDAAAFLTGKPASSRNIRSWVPYIHHLPFFNLMPNDGMEPCYCPECWSHFKQGMKSQHVSDFMWQYFADFANELKKRNVPGYLTTMAYGSCKPVPKCALPDNIIVMVATGGPYYEGMAMQKAEYQRISDWRRKLGSKPYLWTYPTKACGPVAWVPNHAPHAVGSFMKKVAPDIFGAFQESETDIWLLGYLNYYVSSKLLWDSSADVEKMLDEHHRLMFGSAAPEMKKIYDRWEELWMKKVCGDTVDTPVGPQRVVPSQSEIWTRIYDEKEINAFNALFDAAEKKCANDPDALKRVRFIRSEIWGNVLYGAKKFRNSSWIPEESTIAEVPAGEKITIDGNLADKAWKNAPAVWLRIRKGEVTPVATKVKMLRDKEYFYFGFECEEPETEKIVSSEKRAFDDQNLWEDNCVEIYLDPTAQRKEYYQIMISSANKVCDLHVKPGFMDWKWNSGVKSATKVVPGKCWFAEVAVPRKSMVSAASGRINADFSRLRTIKGKTEYYNWITRPNRSVVEHFGVLLFNAPQSRNILSDPDMQSPVTEKRFMNRWCSVKVLLRDTQVFRFGGSSIRLEGGKCDRFSQFIKGGLKPNTKYRFSYYLKLEDLSRPGLHVRVFEGNRHVHVFPTVNPKGTAPWHKLEFTFTSGKVAPTKAGEVFFLIGKSTGKVWIDRVILEEIR